MPERSDIQERDEFFGCPSYPKPDAQPPPGWSHTLAASIERPRSHSPSPDGTQIAFFWERDDHTDLYVMPAQGGWPRRLSFERPPLPYWFDDPPQWSPDGSQIAYTARNQVWVVPVTGGQPIQIAAMLNGLGSPRWMPDSRHLLVTYQAEHSTRILVLDCEDEFPQSVSPPGGCDGSPQAAPNGKQIVYLHQPAEDLRCTHLMLFDLACQETRQLTNIPDRMNRSPRWSPQGDQLAYTSDRTGFFEVYLLNPETGAEQQLTHAGHDLDDLCWSPDGKHLVGTLNLDGAFNLVIIDAQTGKLENLRTAEGFHARPHWLPDGQTITFEYDDPQHPADLYKVSLADRQTTQLTFCMPPALQALRLVKPTPVHYPSFDGVAIPAFLYLPEKPNGAALLYPHGGPTAQYALEWDAWVQYMAAKGYTILAPNFRGSTGYGLEFQRLNDGKWGVDDTQDCLAGYEYLAGLEAVDAQRVGILGGSYGGYLAICCLAFDPQHRFACAVAKYGDCNLLTSWARCDPTGREDLYRILGHPGANRAGYLAGSPVYQVENIQAPLLIVHGLQDPYVPPEQSEELVLALRRAGKTHEYKTYADEGHGILRRLNLIDLYERMEKFIDWYLL